MEEGWKDIENYEGVYSVSSHGRVKAYEKKIPYLRQTNKSFFAIRKERILRPWESKPKGRTEGYYKVRLRKNGKDKDCYVHILVANAFIRRPRYKVQVNHRDGIKLNNNVDNLEWVTGSENAKHAVRLGLVKLPVFKGKNGR